MTVRKFLDLSTAHLTAETRDAIEAHTINGPVYDHPDGCGWLIWVTVDKDSDIECGEPPDLVAARDLARGLGCDYILFDSDGPIIDGLPVHDDGQTPEPHYVGPLDENASGYHAPTLDEFKDSTI